MLQIAPRPTRQRAAPLAPPRRECPRRVFDRTAPAPPRPHAFGAGAFAVDELNDVEELDGLRLLWGSLLPQTRGATFFHSLDWLQAYWRHFGAGQRPRVLVVAAGGEPIGILPLVVRREPTRLGLVRVLTYPLNDWGSFYGPIGPNAAATLLGGMRHVHATRRDWDVLDLRWIDAAGCDHGRTPHAMRMAGFRPHKQVWDRTAVVDLGGTWEQYWSARSKKWRHNVERCHRRLDAEGKLVHIRYRPDGAAWGDGDPRWDLYDACEELALRSWQGSATDGTTLSHARVRPFLRDAHEAAARTGALDLNLLELDGRPVAFAYNYHYSGSVYGLRAGYDPAAASCGPGSVLTRLVLEDSFARGDRLYDMGVGSMACKRHWLTSVAASHRYAHYPWGSPRSQLLRLKRWVDGWRDGQHGETCGCMARNT